MLLNDNRPTNSDDNDSNNNNNNGIKVSTKIKALVLNSLLV